MKVADFSGNVGNIRKQIIAVVILAVAVTAVADAIAGTKEWDGFASGNDFYWTTNNNWKGIGGAGPNDNLVFGDEVCNLITGCFTTLKNTTTTNDFPINTSFKSLTLSGTRYTVRGNQIFLQNGLSFGKSLLVGDAVRPETTWKTNIVLGNSQLWRGRLGNLIVNGVVNLDGHQLQIDLTDSLTMNGAINGFGAIDNIGDGLLIINGNVMNSAVTRLDNGTVEVNGSLGAVDLRAGTLRGSGLVNEVRGKFATNAVISPGKGANTTALLRTIGDVELNGNVTLEIDLNGSEIGTDYDQLSVTNGDIRLAGADLDVHLGFVPVTGEQFVVVSNIFGGQIIGQFDQENLLVEDGLLFQITYNPDRVVLTCLGPAIP